MRSGLKEPAGRLLLVVVSTVVAGGCAEVFFRWYTGQTFDRKFPAWTGNLAVARGAQVFAFLVDTMLEEPTLRSQPETW